MGETPGWVEPTPPSDPTPPPPLSWGPPPPQYGQYGAPPQYGQYGPPPQYGQYGQPGPPWGGYRPEYKPGIVPLRPLSVGEVLDGSFATIRRHPRIVFGCAAVLAIISQLIRLGVGFAFDNLPSALGSTTFTKQDGTGNTTVTSGSVVVLLVSLVVDSLCAAVLAGVVTGVVGKAIIGQQPEGREILEAVKKRWLGLLAVSVLATILPFTPVLLLLGGLSLGFINTGLGILGGILGGVAMVVFGLLLWGRLALAVPIFVLERKGPLSSIARSWRLVRGAFWRVWGLRALVQIIVGAGAGALSVPLTVVLVNSASKGTNPSTLALTVVAIGGAVIWMVTQPLFAASLTLIYVDRRMRAEGLDLQLTQAALRTTGPTGSPRS